MQARAAHTPLCCFLIFVLGYESKAPAFRRERDKDGARRCGQPKWLLFIVKGHTLDFHAHRISGAGRESTAPTVGSDDDLGGHRYFATLFRRQLEGVSVDLFERSSVRGWIARHRIVLAIELADPHRVSGLAIRVDTIHCGFYAVTGGGFIRNACILGEPGS